MKRGVFGVVAASLILGTIVPTAFAQSTSNQKHYKSSITLDGKTISSPFGIIASDGSTMTTYMPMYYIDQALAKAGYKVSWDGNHHVWNLTLANETPDLSSVSVGTGNTSIMVNGNLVKKINTIVLSDFAANQNSEPTVYVPIYYVQPLLEAVGIQNSWDGVKQVWGATSPFTLDSSITYGQANGSTDVDKNLVITGKDVTVQNVNVHGNIYLNPGSSGNVYLNHVSATGTIFILSGALHSVHLNAVTAPSLDIYSASPVHVVSEGSTHIGMTVIPPGEHQSVTLDQQSGSLGDIHIASSSPVTLSGSAPFSSVSVMGGSNLEMTSNTTVGSLTVSGSGADIHVDNGAQVTNLTVEGNASGINITNNGNIGTLTNDSASSGVTLGGSGQVTSTQGNVPTGGGNSGGGSTGGGGGSGGSGGGGGGSNSDVENAALAKFVDDLQDIHTQLAKSGSGMAAVQQSEAAAKKIKDWGPIVYGSLYTKGSSSQDKFANVMHEVIGLTSYGALSQDKSTTAKNVQDVLKDVQSLDSSINGSDLYALYKSFRTHAVSDLLNQSNPSATLQTIVAQAFQDAVNDNPKFQTLLTKYGVDPSNFKDVITRTLTAIDPSSAAITALVNAAIAVKLGV